MTCACGCGEPLSGRQRLYASNACKARVWKDKTGYRLQGRQERCQTPKERRSGRQVSYRKAVDEVAFFIRYTNQLDPDRARALAEDILTRALPERQR